MPHDGHTRTLRIFFARSAQRLEQYFDLIDLGTNGVPQYAQGIVTALSVTGPLLRSGHISFFGSAIVLTVVKPCLLRVFFAFSLHAREQYFAAG